MSRIRSMICMFMLAISSISFAQDDAGKESVLEESGLAPPSPNQTETPPIGNVSIPPMSMQESSDRFVEHSHWNIDQNRQAVDWSESAPRLGHGWQDYHREIKRDRIPKRTFASNQCQVANIGFAVDEVQYGANAGTPSFGLVSHGPWYNGETFGLFGNCRRCKQQGSKLPNLDRILKRRKKTELHYDSGSVCRDGNFAASNFSEVNHTVPSPNMNYIHGPAYVPNYSTELGPAPTKIPANVNPESSQKRDGKSSASTDAKKPTEIED